MRDFVALGLYRYGLTGVSGKQFYAFYSQAIRCLVELGLSATHIAGGANEGQGKLRAIEGPHHKAMLNSGFADVQTLSIVSADSASKYPSDDAIVRFLISYVPEKGELTCIFVADAGIDGLQDTLKNLLIGLLEVTNWDYGHAFFAPERMNPYFYLLEIDDGQRTGAELQELELWYSKSDVERVRTLRGVYWWNIFGHQLSRSVGRGGRLLIEILEESGLGRIERLDCDTVLWEVEDINLDRAKALLVSTGHITVKSGDAIPI